MASGTCDDCDRECKEHGEMILLVSQHDERISNIETTATDTSNDIAKMEGRVTTFIWILGLVFGIICMLAFYGSLQIAAFKDVYTKDSIASNKALANIEANMQHVKRDIEDVKRKQEKR